jgi:foldase protein PrsA
MQGGFWRIIVKGKIRQILGVGFVAAVVVLAFVYIRFFNGTFIYISTGLKSSELFKVGTQKAYTWEADILLSDAKTEYESVFGSSVWSQTMEGINMDDYVKDQVKAKLIRVKCMNIMAKKKGVVLSRTQKDAVSSAADAFFNGLTQEQVSSLNITRDDIADMFTQFAIADTLYDDITSQTDTEVSSDDARVITIQYISTDCLSDITAAKQRLDDGEAFYTVAKDYGGEEESETEIKRGELDTAFENAAFDLKTGETSPVVESQGRYYIIKCTSDNEKYKTEANKVDLVEQKKLEYFNSVFEEYEASKYVEFNKKKWSAVRAEDALQLSVSFEDIFNEYVK